MIRLTKKEQALIDLGQGCVDWADDTDDCHFCRRDDDGKHDAGCPVGEYVRKHLRKRR